MTRAYDSDTASVRPATRAAAVTPSDSADLAISCRAVSVNGDGDVSLITTGGDTVTIRMVVGVPFPIEARRIRSTGTTATGIVALW